jgi:hypothetical protein
MSIVIQQADAREYLALSPDDWVRDPHDARLFPHARAALNYCQEHDLGNVRLVVFLQNQKISVLLYVPGSSRLEPADTKKPATV